MPLTNSCKESIGVKLFVLPYYGYGWSRVDSGPPTESRLDALGPEPFYLQVEECIYCEGEIMGVSGVVSKTGEIFDGFWCCCLLRSVDAHDFTAHCGEYIVCISKKKLKILPEPYPKKALGDWLVHDKSVFCWGGYGTVAESVDWVKDIYDRTIKGREQARMNLTRQP